MPSNQSGADKMAEQGSMQKFPAFEGKDLDGNTVKSEELFSGNAVTVVNFWFTTCNPCVGELAELDALNKELAEKGGSLIGVNTFTLDGDKAAIADAKDVLMKKRNQHILHALHGMCEQLSRRGKPPVFHGPAYAFQLRPHGREEAKDHKKPENERGRHTEAG